MSQAALVLDNVSKHYGDFVAVGEVSLEVPRGSIYGLLGPNGAGKTTCLRMVNDISMPDTGKITLHGSLPPGPEASRRIGYLPEERGLYPKMRVLDLLQFFAELRGMTRRTARERGAFWLERLGIADWKGHLLQDLSKGMQQKVQFATALIHDPELLILDEPWSGLDPINAEVLRSVVLEQKEAGNTVVFSTHLMEQAEQICDSVCILARGKKVLEGPLGDVMSASAGHTLAVEVDGDQAQASNWLHNSPTVSSHTTDEARLEVRLAEGQGPAKLLQDMIAAGLKVRHYQPLQPSLHQIFVERVGAASGTEMSGREVNSE